jgi:hypothetical protein
MMERIKGTAQRFFACLLCAALLIWSVTPSFTHAPKVFETIQDHLEMVADHGHSHGLEEDLYWVMHGHSHDVADHDHSLAFLLSGYKALDDPLAEDSWRTTLSTHGPSRQFRIDRPPRV